MLYEGAPPHIRVAGPDDAAALLDMLHEVYEDNAAFSVNWAKVESFVKKAADRDGAFILVVDGNNEIAASLALLVVQEWYTDEWLLAERWNYVRRAYRHSHYALDLIEVGTRISDRWNLAFAMGINSTIRLEAKIRLYRRKMTMAGAFFIHGMDRCDGPLGLKARDRPDSG